MFARILIVFAWGLLAAGEASAAGGHRVGDYDFAYLLGGDAPARPVQVFDDGRDTYLQFRSGAQVPAIFAMHAGVPQLLVPLPDGPYLRVPQLHGRLLLQLGAAQATAIHARGERLDAPHLTPRGAADNRQPVTVRPEASATRMLVSLPPPQPSPREVHEADADQRSYARPLAGDSLQWEQWRQPVEHAIAFPRGSQALSREAQQAVSRVVQRATPGTRFVVIGRDDDSYKEHLEQARAEALRDALRRAGVSPERIALRTGAMRAGSRAGSWESTVVVETAEPVRAPTQAPEPVRSPAAPPTAAAPERPASGFTLGVADRTISGAVRRWAQGLGYQLVWDAPEPLDAPITGEATLPGDSLQAALEHLLRGLQAQGYWLEVTLHANRVIRFTPAAQPRPAAAPPAPEPARDTARPLLRAGASSTP